MASAGRGLGGRAEQAEPAVPRGKRGPFGAGARFPVVRIHGEHVEVILRSFHFGFVWCCFLLFCFFVFRFSLG